jgi:chromate transport protein ChrA
VSVCFILLFSAGVASAAAPLLPTASNIFWLFAKAGAFVFGSGLAIVPFLYGELVQANGWLDDRQLLDSVAVAMITPGPVGAIGGAAYVLAARALVDVWTVALAVITFCRVDTVESVRALVNRSGGCVWPAGGWIVSVNEWETTTCRSQDC